MKKIKTMLIGILIIVLANNSMTMFTLGGEGTDFLFVMGFLAPPIGLIIFLAGFFMKEKSEEAPEEEDKKE
ncbi:MAG: hypothetical protein IJ432_01535 [Clostridia bacterium]|mgnify:CR=1 FL=1|nr:hypothetical protein [Clostridia bacterium]